MSLLDDVSIVVTPNGYKAGTLYGVLPTYAEGSELVVNGDFATDTVWNKGSNWTIGSGLATRASGVTSNLSQVISGISGKLLKVNYTVSSYGGSGWIGASPNGSDFNTNTGNGTFTDYITPTGDNLYIRASYSFSGSIDNVSIKEVTTSDMDVTRATAATRVDEDGLVNYAEILGDELVTNGDFATDSNWTKGTGWSIANDKASYDGSGTGYQYILQSITTTSGKLYKINFDVLSSTGSNLNIVDFGSVRVNQTHLSAGNYTYYAEADASSENLTIYANGTDTFSIDNVSVKEVDRDNVPRIDYTGGGCPHILAEPQRTNLIPYSEDFSQWSNTGVQVNINSTISPSGTENASTITGSTTNSRHNVVVSTISGSVSASFSVFAKAKELRYLQIASANSVNQYANFDLLSGTIGTIGGGFSNVKIESLDNDWYKISLVSNSQYNSIYLSLASSLTASWLETYSMANNSDSLYLWGAQVEVGSYATSYIPTSGSTVTRNQDVFTRDGIGSLINDSEGVLFVEIAALADDETYRQISISDGTATNRISLFFQNTSNQIAVESAGSGTNLGIYNQNLTITNSNKIALKYKVNDCALWVNGVEVATDTSFAAFSANTLNKLSFDRGDGLQKFYGKVKQLQVYTRALTDDQLAALTT